MTLKVSSNHELCIKNEEFCIENDEFLLKTMNFVLKTRDFLLKMMFFAGSAVDEILGKLCHSAAISMSPQIYGSDL